MVGCLAQYITQNFLSWIK